MNVCVGSAGVPMVGNAINTAIDVGSNWLDENFGTKSNKQIQDLWQY